MSLWSKFQEAVRPKASVQIMEREYSSRELSEVLLDAVPELRESLTQADIELALDDRGWLGFGQPLPGDFDQRTRKTIVERSRLFWFTDPLAKQAVRLWTTYCLGNGMSYKAEDTDIQSKLDAFTKNRRNQRMMNPAGQQRTSNKLLIDGEVFFALFATEPVPSLRTIDPLQIQKVITDPEDEERVLCYRRHTVDGNKTLYYADWALEEDDISDVEATKDPENKKPITLQRDANGATIPVYHLAFDPMGKRGNGLLSCCTAWSREHRRFMEARVGITQALAKFAYKVTAKGGQAVVNAITARLQSSLTQTGMSAGLEKNPPPASGATWTQNQGVDLTPMPRATGAGDAKEDGNSLKLMVCAGTGIMLHYFGDPSTGNLATATAMELPMLKMFQGYQELLKGAYRDIFAMVLDEDIDEEPAKIEIELPAILDEDLGPLGQFLTQLTSVFPEAKVPEVLRPALISLGVEDIDAVMLAIEQKKKEDDAKALADQKAEADRLRAAAENPAQPAPPISQESLREFTDAVRKFEEGISKLAGAVA
jgi:hypothetical protein